MKAIEFDEHMRQAARWVDRSATVEIGRAHG